MNEYLVFLIFCAMVVVFAVIILSGVDTARKGLKNYVLDISDEIQNKKSHSNKNKSNFIKKFNAKRIAKIRNTK